MESITSRTLKATLHLLLLVITLRCANTARILEEEVDTAPPLPVPALGPPEAPNQVIKPVSTVAPVVGPAATTPTATSPLAATSATVANADPQHAPLFFFMHDILGGSAPSSRVVAGIIANTQIIGIPFSTTTDRVFPMVGGVPLVNANTGIVNDNGIINNGNLPFLAGLNGASTSTVINNNGNNNVATGGDAQPFVTAGQLPAGGTIQQIMFGTITVVDDQLTEGHELGSSVIGRAQGFYLASSLDGTSQTMVLTALFHSGVDHHEEDTLSFFGVHRTAAHESQLAIVGGTGKYENAQGYATVETLHPTDQHTTDGVETLLQFTVYMSYE